MNDISIVIPTKNEVDCLRPVVEELRACLGSAIFEIIVVDAGSKDGTADLAMKLGCKVLLQNEPGYGAAVAQGLALASGKFVTFFDADGSYDPRFLLEAKKALDQEDVDLIFCSRYLPLSGSDDDTPVRFLGNWFFTFALRWLFGVRLTDALHLYVLAKTELVKELPIRSKGFDWCMEFPIRAHEAGLVYREAPFRERKRIAGESKVSALADGLKILSSILSWKVFSSR